ncbi:WXG100 family type VII secretion target [Nonomuraea sp. SYSU D8015]|uniref:WXG100 family type VII secretion target n=1 Tax=Nonomuraea sp. SYSU D8015 TaxID=2593644 RepID=UPI0016617786|nr:hypothetical protein [Nonomuraea sp. SYSU D8015]
MAERGKVEIKLGDGPKGTSVNNSMAEIKQWILNTDPSTVSGAGMTYNNASSKVEQAVNALEANRAKILQIWKGPDAELAGEALDMLQATGAQLVQRMREMGGALGTYATHLQDAHRKINEKVDVPEVSSPSQTQEELDTAYKNEHARKVLDDLNKWIVTVYYSDVPAAIEYNLPTVNLPGVPVDTQNPGYPTGSGTTGPTFGSSAGDYSGGGGSSGGGSGGSSPGSGGSNPGGSNPGGSNPGGSNPGGSDPNNPTNPDPNNPGDPGGPSNPNTPTTPAPGQTQPPGSGDGTVPPVIGDQDRTTTGDTNTVDPRQTAVASYQPPVLTTPAATVPTTSISPPSGYIGPSGSPGIPAIIGSPGVGGSPASAVGPGGRGSGGSSAGMPFMPFMGGAAGAGEHGDLERNTYVPEDASSWTTSHETTDPVIG